MARSLHRLSSIISEWLTEAQDETKIKAYPLIINILGSINLVIDAIV